MSNLLSEAIIDAKALKEAALKNAEAAVIEKYSTEVKQTLDNLLEQEEEMLADPLAGLEDPAADPAADLGGAEEDPMAAAGEEEIPDLAPEVPLAAGDGIGEDPRKEGSPVEFNVDLQALQEAVAELEGELDEEEDIEINEIDLAALFEDDEIEITEEESSDTPDPEADVDYTAGVDDEKGDPVGGEAAAETADSIAMKNAGLEESTEALVDAIMEKLTVDMGADLSGWAGRSSEDMKFEIEKEMAHRRSTDVAEDLETLKKAQEELVFENSQLDNLRKTYKMLTCPTLVYFTRTVFLEIPP